MNALITCITQVSWISYKGATIIARLARLTTIKPMSAIALCHLFTLVWLPTIMVSLTNMSEAQYRRTG